MIPARIDPISPDLHLVTLPPPLPGFENFISVWVKTGRPSFLVDVGPSATVNALVEGLNRLGVGSLDYILLTHIHLDHAGAIGHLSEQVPGASIVCHPTAMSHLVDPKKLWEGSLNTLGNTARAYGPIIPTPEKRLLSAEDFQEDSIKAFLTPGHAPHHVSFQSGEVLFAGEACGVHIEGPSGEIYHRPATPPKFFLETTLKSMDLLLDLSPGRTCFGHYGFSEDGKHWLSVHRSQLLLWKAILEELMSGEGEGEGDFLSICLDRLIQEDPWMKPFLGFDPHTRKRETDLIHNSIKGFLGYLKNPG